MKRTAATLRPSHQAEATVLQQKIDAYGDPCYYVLADVVDRMADSRQPLVPEKLFVSAAGANGDGGSIGPINMLLQMLLARCAGMDVAADGDSSAKATSSHVAVAPSGARSDEKGGTVAAG